MLQTLFGEWWVMCPSTCAYFNVKMSQCSSGLSKPSLFLPCNPLEPKCSPSSVCPHRGAQSGEGQGIDMWDWLGQWLGRMVQVSEEIVSYLVRYLLHQVIGLLHLLCYEMLRCWLGLLLQSTAQTEDTRRGSRAFKRRKQSPVMAELLPATSVRAVTPSGRCHGGENAFSKDFTSSEISDAPTALCISTGPRKDVGRVTGKVLPAPR